MNRHLGLGDIPGWDNHNHAGFADADLAILSRKMFADALQRRVDPGSLPRNLMVPLAERVLYKNAEKLYGFSVDA
jgi:hypothetical protein